MKPSSYANAVSGKSDAPVGQAQTRSSSLSVLPPIPDEPESDTETGAVYKGKGKEKATTSQVPILLKPIPQLSPPISQSRHEDTKSAISGPGNSSQPSCSVSLFPSVPYVIDAISLRRAVALDSTHIFSAIQKLVAERDALRVEGQRTKEELNSALGDFARSRKDWDTAKTNYENLIDIAGKKQVILWKFIERLKEGTAVEQMGKLNSLVPPQVEGKGFAVEKWRENELSEESSSKAAGEGSETEESYYSAEGSLSGKNLDPSAHAFVPTGTSPTRGRPRSHHTDQDRRSPGKLREQKLKGPIPDRSPPKFNLNPVQPPGPMPLHDHTQQIANYMPANTFPATQLNEVVASLPARFYAICPHSLIYATPCPLGMGCRHQQLCRDYNEEGGSGCLLENPGKGDHCSFAHVYRNCMLETENGAGGCWWYANTAGTSAAAQKIGKAKKAAHFKVRAHQGHCPAKEWIARSSVLALRDAHAQGLYN